MSKIWGQGYDGLIVIVHDYLSNLVLKKVAEALNLGEIESGKGLNQEHSLSRPDHSECYKSVEQCFTEEKSRYYQCHDSVSLTKEQLQSLRNDGWENFFNRVISFYKNHEIKVLDMNDYYVPHGRPRRFFKKMFRSVIDLQIQELNNRFDEVNMELLICMASLNPANSFVAFDKQKILRLAEFYPHDFTKFDPLELEFQLQMYIVDVRNDARFQYVKDFGGLSCMLVETNKHKTYTIVYLLLKLVLILSMTTTSVERVFSAMSFVKNIFLQVNDESVLRRFQNMKTRWINF
uniref:HAT C-terminal dimerisation domain-containing protein n=1 Tax=Kalanchoe fedtschenkoi TaxID=63787 RepID=A0A7N0TU12_KALFE